MQTANRNVPPDRLLLDPNNYRFHDIQGYKQVAQRSRYHEPGVQDRAIQLLQETESFELGALRDSILSNGYVPIEQIVAEHFDDDGGSPRYLVIEGNRRVAAVKTLIRDHNAGAADIPAEVYQSVVKLPVVEITGTHDERLHYQKTLMAIRHVAGIREWGPYQQAKLVVELFEREEHAFGVVAQRIGISAPEVARRYRASKALQQMEDDDEFSEHALPRLYSFFHEAVSQPKVREWLKFSDETYRAEDGEAKRLFYELLSPREVEGTAQPPKLQNANRQVRQLKDIVDKEVPLKILADPEQPFEDAVKAAETETVQDETGVLENSFGVALQALRRPSIDAWVEPTDRAKDLWKEIMKIVNSAGKFMN